MRWKSSLSGERVDAETAFRIGLVNRIHEKPQLLEKTLDYATMLARRAPLAQRFAKDVMRRNLRHANGGGAAS